MLTPPISFYTLNFVRTPENTMVSLKKAQSRWTKGAKERAQARAVTPRRSGGGGGSSGAPATYTDETGRATDTKYTDGYTAAIERAGISRTEWAGMNDRARSVIKTYESQGKLSGTSKATAAGTRSRDTGTIPYRVEGRNDTNPLLRAGETVGLRTGVYNTATGKQLVVQEGRRARDARQLTTSLGAGEYQYNFVGGRRQDIRVSEPQRASYENQSRLPLDQIGVPASFGRPEVRTQQQIINQRGTRVVSAAPRSNFWARAETQVRDAVSGVKASFGFRDARYTSMYDDALPLSERRASTRGAEVGAVLGFTGQMYGVYRSNVASPWVSQTVSRVPQGLRTFTAGTTRAGVELYATATAANFAERNIFTPPGLTPRQYERIQDNALEQARFKIPTPLGDFGNTLFSVSRVFTKPGEATEYAKQQISLETGMGAAQIQSYDTRLRWGMGIRAATETFNLGRLSVRAEQLGQKLIVGSLERGATRASGRTPFFWKSFLRIGRSTGAAGLTEGGLSVLNYQLSRNKPINARDIAIGTGIGGLSAGTLGGFIGAKGALKPGVARSLIDASEFGANIADPYEKIGDKIAESLARGSRPRARVPVITTSVAPTGVETFTLSAQTPSEGKKGRARTPGLGRSPTNVFSNIFSKTTTRTTLPSQTRSPTNAFTPTNTRSNVFSSIFSPTPTITPTPVPSITPTYTPTPTTTKTPVNIQTPIGGLPFIFPPFGPKDFGYGKAGLGTKKKGFGYAPSFTAIAKNIISTKPPKARRFTGLELRPIIRPRRA